MAGVCVVFEVEDVPVDGRVEDLVEVALSLVCVLLVELRPALNVSDEALVDDRLGVFLEVLLSLVLSLVCVVLVELCPVLNVSDEELEASVEELVLESPESCEVVKTPIEIGT